MMAAADVDTRIARCYRRYLFKTQEQWPRGDGRG